jgi:hypothetical protein
MVYRLHTASGYPREVLNYTFYQMKPSLRGEAVIPIFNRIGIE